MKVKALKISFLALLIPLITSACAYSNAVRSTFIGFSKFREIEPNLYVSPNIGSVHDQAIIKLISDARSRITGQFGTPVSKPKIIITKGEKEQKEFKLYGAPGKVLIAPWGNYLILSEELGNIDVAAHELVHAEIAERLGYFARMRKMPTWLDEGLALQVDQRPRYIQLEGISKLEYERVVSLHSPKLFWSKNREQNIKNYQSSKVAVRTLVIPTIEQKGLYGILEEIKSGESVESIIEQ